ncbi:hypothetical protein [Acinetobacter guillouiae]|uniref:hypothetical protein n=1 Tax=Acinetobacter guillouiae TaxID=106649 RepID=UPI002FDB3B9A
MDEATIRIIITELAKGLKTSEDLNEMTAVFQKFMIENESVNNLVSFIISK